ncbi:MAG TPA: hypothetical protein VEA41_00185 [Salinarimonas sp.]|nr:hypothetical protein [Salinarimonas sp.]
MTTIRTRTIRYAFAASAAALILAGGLVEPSGRDVRLDLGEARVEVGAWRVGGSLWSAALAQTVRTVTLENVTVSVDAVTYRLPRILFEGASLSREELAGLFDAKAPQPLHERLARLSALRISAPQLVIEQKAKESSATITYTGLVVDTMDSGRITSGGAEGATFEIKEDGAPVAKGAHGRMSLKDVDLAFATRVATETAAPNAPMQVLYGAVTVDNLTVHPDGTDGVVRVGRIAAADIRARPTNPSWNDMGKALAAIETGGKSSKEDQAKAMRLLGELFGAMSVGRIEFTDISARDESPDNRFAVSRIAYVGGDVAETRMEGLSATTEDGTVRLGELSFRGFSFKPVIDGLAAVVGKIDGEMTAADLRALVPTLGSVRALDLLVDVPSSSEPDNPAKRSRVGVREVSIEPGPQRNGIPTSLKLAISSVTADLTPDLQENGLKALADLGYRSVDLSWTAQAVWREPAKELAIESFAVTGRDMGRISVSAVAGDVGPDVFSPDAAVALVGLLGASARSLEVSIQNGGLYERFLAQESRKKRRSVEALRAEYAATATLGIPVVLGGTPQARNIGETVGRFIAKPGTLRLVATPKDPRGLGVTELMSVSDPMALLQRVDIKATLE